MSNTAWYLLTLSVSIFLCHSLEEGNPDSIKTNLDSRLRGNDSERVKIY